ncbi:metalloprotease 1 [Colletotrichum orchidophilum]|uniref:Metalloprotease 1 n=1 Tax=Colletotrichum orchidophilum TaxID=1209926 RepID=A0A1G4BEY0_9PEZI|nr:metalloprotease 1 [Colletotrichum orchidophilum]OHE99933.1 metalloprotease 1 [Colletotrichum orchidophilum]
MAHPSCLVLNKSSSSTRPSADILSMANYQDAQELVEAVKGTLKENTSATKRFLNAYLLFRKPTVSIATLRPIEVPSLTALPPWKALIRHTAIDEAFTEAVDKPEMMDQGFYNHMVDLYDDVFVDIDQQNDRIVLPQHALVIEYKMSLKAKKIIGGMASVVGGLIVIAVKVGESN